MLCGRAFRRWEIQEEARRLAVEVGRRDGVDLQLRVGLNSGQVIAGEIGSGRFGYTAIGEQVGMAQRMESVAPPGGVMLSESTARLVENAALLGEPEVIPIKGSDLPVPARRLLAARQRGRTCSLAANLGGPRPGGQYHRRAIGSVDHWPRMCGRCRGTSRASVRPVSSVRR